MPQPTSHGPVRESRPPILLTPGEPAGIGPAIACRIAAQIAAGSDTTSGHASGNDSESDSTENRPVLLLVADPELLERTCSALGLKVEIDCMNPAQAAVSRVSPGRVQCWPVALRSNVSPGHLSAANAPYVLACLEQAAQACRNGEAGAMVTGPIHKGVINDAGIRFSGHTEFLAEQAGVERVVMMLTAGELRVALVTTHLPLREVADALTADRLTKTLRILDRDLRDRFGLHQPRIAVLGLNPHAGESGHLGHEEIEVIEPEIARLRANGLNLVGPLPADTAFLPERVKDFDAVLAMYHDQGLPVLKHAGFGESVNITLGLPFIRTSVDHGTALDLALNGPEGLAKADTGSLKAAIDLAVDLVDRSANQSANTAASITNRGRGSA